MTTKVAHLNVDPDLKKVLADIATDLAAINAKLTAADTDNDLRATEYAKIVADAANLRTTVNAVITAAATDIAAVAAVTPATAATATAFAASTTGAATLATSNT